MLFTVALLYYYIYIIVLSTTATTQGLLVLLVSYGTIILLVVVLLSNMHSIDSVGLTGSRTTLGRCPSLRLRSPVQTPDWSRASSKSPVC